MCICGCFFLSDLQAHAQELRKPLLYYLWPHALSFHHHLSV